MAKLLGWRHPGFSAHVGDRIAAGGKQRLETYRRLPGPQSPLPQEARVSRWSKRRALPLEDEALPGAKVYQVNPLLCTRCGQRMSIFAFVTEQLAIGRILDHLGLSTPGAEKPPPLREVLRVAQHHEGWGVPEA